MHQSSEQLRLKPIVIALAYAFQQAPACQQRNMFGTPPLLHVDADFFYRNEARKAFVAKLHENVEANVELKEVQAEIDAIAA